MERLHKFLELLPWINRANLPIAPDDGFLISYSYQSPAASANSFAEINPLGDTINLKQTNRSLACQQSYEGMFGDRCW